MLSPAAGRLAHSAGGAVALFGWVKSYECPRMAGVRSSFSATQQITFFNNSANTGAASSAVLRQRHTVCSAVYVLDKHCMYHLVVVGLLQAGLDLQHAGLILLQLLCYTSPV
jgi:hypothetical protein